VRQEPQRELQQEHLLQAQQEHLLQAQQEHWWLGQLISCIVSTSL
jgi:hypothetical protein